LSIAPADNSRYTFPISAYRPESPYQRIGAVNQHGTIGREVQDSREECRISAQ
jgi:hypothetical protein